MENQGRISGKIKIPANIPAGTKLVQFYGDKGSYGDTTYTGKKNYFYRRVKKSYSSKTS